MGSEVPVPVVDEANVTVETTEGHCCTKNKVKVPKRIHKAEREKLKREQLNDLFLELANALDLTQPNNGKASILSETTRLLKDLVAQIESLKKENASLLSESQYVTVEKNELKEENSTLETQIEKLQKELQTRVAQSKHDPNVPAPEFHHHGSTRNCAATADTTLPQPPVFVVPFHPDLQAYPLTKSHVRKPHARYPNPTDSWPSQLLGDQLAARKEVQISDSNNNVCGSDE